MLVIRRRAGESLLVGDSVEVEVLEVTQGQVKLGIRAPREVVVLRKEVQVATDENRAASLGVPAESLSAFLASFVRPDSKERETRR